MNDEWPLSLQSLKSALDINTDSSDDALFQILEESNSEVSKTLAPYAENVPLSPGTILYRDARLLALSYSKYLWNLHLHQLEDADAVRKEFELKRRSFISYLKSYRTTRTRSILISDDPRENKLILPSQRDTFVLGDF